MSRHTPITIWSDDAAFDGAVAQVSERLHARGTAVVVSRGAAPGTPPGCQAADTSVSAPDQPLLIAVGRVSTMLRAAAARRHTRGAVLGVRSGNGKGSRPPLPWLVSTADTSTLVDAVADGRLLTERHPALAVHAPTGTQPWSAWAGGEVAVHRQGRRRLTGVIRIAGTALCQMACHAVVCAAPSAAAAISGVRTGRSWTRGCPGSRSRWSPPIRHPPHCCHLAGRWRWSSNATAAGCSSGSTAGGRSGYPASAACR